MGQGQLVVTLLSLLVLGLGATALMVTLYTRAHQAQEVESRPSVSYDDRLDLARRRRAFLQRYPAWSGRDFQNDTSSPWYTDPEFNQVASR